MHQEAEGHHHARSKVMQYVIGALAVAGLILFAYLLIQALPLIQEVWRNRANEAATQTDLKNFGVKGILLIMLLQTIMTASSVLPDMPVQVLAGLVYGKWAIPVCLIGMLLANAAMFMLARFGGEEIHRHFHHSKHPSAKHPAANKLLSFEKIKNMKHPEWLVFFINLIPGFPNGMLPLLFGQTKMSTFKFLFFVAIAELPSLVISTGIGSTLASGNRVVMVILVVVLLAMIVCAYLFKDKLTGHIERFSGGSSK